MPKHNVKSKMSGGPKPSSVSYSGPVKVGQKREQIEMINLSSTVLLSTTSVSNFGIYNTVFPASGMTSSTNWSSIAGTFQECRCLGIEVQYLPAFQNAIPGLSALSGPTYASPLFLAKYHQDPTAISTLNAAVNHMSRVAKPINNSSETITVLMKEVSEATWSPTASPSIGIFGVKSFLSTATIGATDVTDWGTFLITYLAQFRNRVLSSTQFSTESLLPHITSTFPSLGSISASSDTKQKAAPTKESKEEKTLSKPTVLGLPYDKPPLSHSTQQRYVYVCSEPASPTQLPFPVKITSRSD
jgi:hypothetical protein